MKDLAVILKELIEAGFEIDQISDNEFKCIDNGRFGFCGQEDPFIIDADELRDLHEVYL